MRVGLLKHRLDLSGQGRNIYGGHGKGGHEYLDALRLQQRVLLSAAKIGVDDIQVHQRDAAFRLTRTLCARDGDGQLGFAAAVIAHQHGVAFVNGQHYFSPPC